VVEEGLQGEESLAMDGEVGVRAVIRVLVAT
jgi:hypothetical protein